MFTRLQHAALLLAPLFVATACGDVAKCPTGTLGCLNGRPDSGACKFDLVVSNNRCVRKRDASDAGVTTTGGYCDSWTDSEYREYVQPGARCDLVEATDPYYVKLTPAQLFDELCQSHCIQDHVHAREYCDSSVDFTECSLTQNPGLHTNCLALAQGIAGTGATQAALNDALEGLCNAVASTRCKDTDCLDGNAPVCATLAADICFDDCVVGTSSVANDGFCDDGDTVSAETSDCTYGHDCTDCGPRTRLKKDTPKAAAVGGSCVTNPGCQGFDAHFDNSTAFCTLPSATATDARCLPGCNSGRKCPADMECDTVTVQTSSGPQPLTIYANSVAKACFPTYCN